MAEPAGTTVSASSESPQRGIELLTLGYVIALLTAILGGALRAYLMAHIERQGAPLSEIAFSRSVLHGGLLLAALLSRVLLLIGLDGIARAPREARTESLARAAQWLVGAALLLRFLPVGLPHLLEGRGTAEIGQILHIFMGIGLFEAGLEIAEVILVGEALLRLRRYATPPRSPQARALEDGDGLVRAGLIAALAASFLSSYAAPVVGRLLGHGAWLDFLLRMPFSIALYATLLWLLQSTGRLLVGQGPAALGAHDA